jgi:hypothetical protein
VVISELAWTMALAPADASRLSTVSEHPIRLGLPRGSADGGRRYRPIRVDFDTRNVTLDLEIQEEWDPDMKAIWEDNKAKIRAHVLSELGDADGERKLENYRAMGPAPWSVVFEHTALLRQVRSSFAHGDFYPTLVSACALGERLLNQLVLTLRADYVNHPSTTKKVRSGSTSTNWKSLIDVLHGWGVLDDEIAEIYLELKDLRHTAIHFDPALSAAGREPALAALLALQQIVERVFERPATVHSRHGRSVIHFIGGGEGTVDSTNLPATLRAGKPGSSVGTGRRCRARMDCLRRL